MTGPYVLDCSVTMAWFFPTEAGATTDALLDSLTAGANAVVPLHWALEVGNTLLAGERHKRCTIAESAQFLGLLGALAIEADPDTAARAPGESIALARSHSLTHYDAAYLELGARRNLPLATLDRALRTAARKLGLAVLPERI